MITVKVSTNFPHWPLTRQTPGNSGEWGNCRFVVNREIDECDFWVVMDGLTQPETCRCDPSNTLLVTCEPPDVKTYAAKFTGQFGAVLTCHRTLLHGNVLFGQQGLPWMIGARLEPVSLKWSNFLTFEEIERHAAKKERLLSMVASKDTLTPGHAARNRFIEALKRAFGDRVDVFGLGYAPIADKLDAIAPYRFHIAAENSCVPDYWTEKLADAYLGRAYPIYSGCPNLAAYFPAGSYEPFEIGDPAAALVRVRALIESNVDVVRKAELEEARRKVLYDYNLFAVLDALIQRRAGAGGQSRLLTLQPENASQQQPIARRNPALALLTRLKRHWGP